MIIEPYDSGYFKKVLQVVLRVHDAEVTNCYVCSHRYGFARLDVWKIARQPWPIPDDRHLVFGFPAATDGDFSKGVVRRYDVVGRVHRMPFEPSNEAQQSRKSVAIPDFKQLWYQIVVVIYVDPIGKFEGRSDEPKYVGRIRTVNDVKPSTKEYKYGKERVKKKSSHVVENV